MSDSGLKWDPFTQSEEGEGRASIAETTDVELLKRAWRNEKAAPEILKFESDLIQRSREQIQLLATTGWLLFIAVGILLPTAMKKSSKSVRFLHYSRHQDANCNEDNVDADQFEDTVADDIDGGVDDLVVSLYQMDLDRTLFLLRSYLRIRLQKIEKYMIHISKTDLWGRLSEQEQRFAKKCMDIMERHLKQSALDRLPYGYGSMLQQSVSSEEDDMVPKPQLDTFVFCKTKSDVGAFQLDDTGDEIVDLVADDLYVLRYKSIKGLVESGRIDLV